MPPGPAGNPQGGGAGDGSVNGDPTLERIARGNGLALAAAGHWIARHAAVLEAIVADAEQLSGSRPNIFIDVSQSVEHEHPNALEFLRIDCKNVNDFFRRAGYGIDCAMIDDQALRC